MRTHRVMDVLLVGIILLLTTGCPFGVSSSSGEAQAAQEKRDVPAGISQLICTSNLSDVFLAWENGEVYAEISVTREGVALRQNRTRSIRPSRYSRAG